MLKVDESGLHAVLSPAAARDAAGCPCLSPCTTATVLADLASYLHALLRRTPWRQRAKLVAVTPDGLALSPPLASLLPVRKKGYARGHGFGGPVGVEGCSPWPSCCRPCKGEYVST